MMTRRLKLSERNLASMTRDNEDRIVQLQNRVDDMNQEVVKQKREILEYKNKEQNSLEQISAVCFLLSQFIPRCSLLISHGLSISWNLILHILSGQKQIKNKFTYPYANCSTKNVVSIFAVLKNKAISRKE